MSKSIMKLGIRQIYALCEISFSCVIQQRSKEMRSIVKISTIYSYSYLDGMIDRFLIGWLELAKQPSYLQGFVQEKYRHT